MGNSFTAQTPAPQKLPQKPPQKTNITPVSTVPKGTTRWVHTENLVDRSGSMKNMGDVCKTQNDFLNSQREKYVTEKTELQTKLDTLPEGVEKTNIRNKLYELEHTTHSTCNLVTFDNKVEQPHLSVENPEVQLLENARVSEDEIKPRGSTSLWDGCLKAISNTRTLLESAPKDCETHFTIVIFTDGQENTSKKATQQDIFDQISELENRGVTIIFLGANQDAIATAQSIGISQKNALNVGSSEEFHGNAMRAVSDNIARTRTGNGGFSTLDRSQSGALHKNTAHKLTRSPPAGLLTRQKTHNTQNNLESCPSGLLRTHTNI